MTREEWEALAVRCEKAAGPDREIDAALAAGARDAAAASRALGDSHAREDGV